MCEDRGMVIGGLIVAAASLVWAFTSAHAGEQHRAPQHAPQPAAQTSVVVSLDPLALEVRHGRISIELGV